MGLMLLPFPITGILELINIASMNAYLGKNISEICTCDFHNADTNHCAHFVSHVMKYQFGYTCHAHTGKGDKENRANLRVQEVFPQCPTVGLWSDKPSTVTRGLIFITARNNVDLEKKTMVNVPKKHIGIFYGDTVWHYSNSRDQVVSQTSEEFSHHYSGSTITMFYGEFPR